jgi:hypothetical protein
MYILGGMVWLYITRLSQASFLTTVDYYLPPRGGGGADFINGLRIRNRIDPHYFGKLDPDPHQSEKRDPDPRAGALEAQYGAVEGCGRSHMRFRGS